MFMAWPAPAPPFSPPGMTRRGFVTATLAAGFAFAVRPVSAATITTDETGLTTGEIRIRTADAHIPAYRARPEKGMPFLPSWWSRRFSVSTNTSRTFAGALQKAGISR